MSKSNDNIETEPILKEDTIIQKPKMTLNENQKKAVYKPFNSLSNVEKQQATVSAAFFTSAVAGYLLGGPIGSVAAASAARVLTRTEGSKGGEILRGIGKVTIGTSELLRSIDQRFEVLTRIDIALKKAIIDSIDDKKSVRALQRSYESTKSALSATAKIGTDVVNTSIDIIDKVIDSVDKASRVQS